MAQTIKAKEFHDLTEWEKRKDAERERYRGTPAFRTAEAEKRFAEAFRAAAKEFTMETGFAITQVECHFDPSAKTYGYSPVDIDWSPVDWPL